MSSRKGENKTLDTSQYRRVKPKNQHKTPKLSIIFQGSLVKATINLATSTLRQFSGSRRGKITGFSQKSRKRLIELTTRLKSAFDAVFITLTYGQSFPDEKSANVHLDLFMRRLQRRGVGIAIIWRRELQSRGAPHFHLIVFGLPFVDKYELAMMWAEIVGYEYCDHTASPPRPPFTRIESIGDRRKLMSYVSKYVAKVPDEASGFNNVPYFDATTGEVLSTGRHWGYRGYQFLPFAEQIKVVIDYSRKWFANFKRAAACKRPQIKTYGVDSGFSLFVRDPLRWQEYLFYCLFHFSEVA